MMSSRCTGSLPLSSYSIHTDHLTLENSLSNPNFDEFVQILTKLQKEFEFKVM
ncbi:hypothetical protein Hanom_Chr12g01080951 [Helianthus anomalus]